MLTRRIAWTGLLLLVPCFALSCSSVVSPTASTLTFAEMQALNPGVDGEWILAEYPFARDVVRRPDGSLERLGYWVNDPQGKARPLMMTFDGDGMLARKQYGGPVVRPPPKSENAGFGGA